MRRLALASLLALLLGTPVAAAEADLQVSVCTAEALEQAVGAWLQPLAGNGLELVRKPTLSGAAGPGRLHVRVADSALARLVVPVEVQVQQPGGTRLLYMTWRRAAAVPAPSSSASATRGQAVVLVARAGSVEVESPGKVLSSGGAAGQVRVLNVQSGRILMGTWLEGDRVLVDGKANR